MSSEQEWASAGIDVTTPSTARIYDYALGGKDNFAVDREVAEKAFQAVPDGRAHVQQNRAFLREAVRYLVNQGMRQFIDVGTGLPTAGNVHEVAQEVAPHARVVYVDNDPIVLVHARALLADNETTTVIDADLRRPRDILDHPEVRSMIDFDEPVGVLFVSVLHFVSDDEDPAGALRLFRDRLAPGSYLALSHVTADSDPQKLSEAARLYDSATSRLTLRSRDEIRALFDGFDLESPGLVPVSQWRPGAPAMDEPDAIFLGGVGRLRGSE